jgi:hypothetical protein
VIRYTQVRGEKEPVEEIEIDRITCGDGGVPVEIERGGEQIVKSCVDAVPVSRTGKIKMLLKGDRVFKKKVVRIEVDDIEIAIPFCIKKLRMPQEWPERKKTPALFCGKEIEIVAHRI